MKLAIKHPPINLMYILPFNICTELFKSVAEYIVLATQIFNFYVCFTVGVRFRGWAIFFISRNKITL
jgi:hypothetical protein